MKFKMLFFALLVTSLLGIGQVKAQEDCTQFVDEFNKCASEKCSNAERYAECKKICSDNFSATGNSFSSELTDCTQECERNLPGGSFGACLYAVCAEEQSRAYGCNEYNNGGDPGDYQEVLSNKVFGTINPTPGVAKYGGVEANGPVVFVNAIIAFITAIAGVLLLINIILAGIKIITSVSDPKGFSEAMKRILWSIIGLVVVAFAYIIAGWVSKQLFGTESFILEPLKQITK